MKFLLKILVSWVLACGLMMGAYAQDIDNYDESFRMFLKDVQENSIRNKDWQKSDWDSYLNLQLDRLPLSTKDNFYRAVQEALYALGDHHSFLLNPSSEETQDQEITQDLISVAVSDGIGIINFPNFTSKTPPTEAFLDSFHQEINQIKPLVSMGWVINLQNNLGGNMYPMLACLSDFWVNQDLGGFYVYSASGGPVMQRLSFDGQSFIYDGETAFTFKHKYLIGTVMLPTVVLIGPNTASSAEFLTLALTRQPNIILAGQTTHGLATGNALLTLPNDMGQYMLTVAHDLDGNDLPLWSEKIEPQIVLDLNNDQVEKAKKLLGFRVC